MGARRRFVIIGVIVAVCVVGLIFVGHWLGWETGFGPEDTLPKQHAKTLWDWMQLLFIPVLLAFGTVWFTTRQNHDRELAREQHENDLRIAIDNQRETAIQAYIDKMSDLLLEKKLLSPTSSSEVREIARVRTLTLLPQLDPIRKRSVLRFLYESGLIKENTPIVDLSYANLRGANLDAIPKVV